MFQWLIGRNNQEVDYWRVKFEQASNQLKKEQEDLRHARAVIVDLQKALETLKKSMVQSAKNKSYSTLYPYLWEKVADFVSNRQRVLIPEVLKHLGLERNKRNADSVGVVLRSLGFKARMMRVNGGTNYGFIKDQLMPYKPTGKPAGRKKTCNCGKCKKCKHREYVKEWREDQKNVQAIWAIQQERAMRDLYILGAF